MVEYLNEEEITEINRLCLKISDEFEEFVVIQLDDIRFIQSAGNTAWSEMIV